MMLKQTTDAAIAESSRAVRMFCVVLTLACLGIVMVHSAGLGSSEGVQQGKTLLLRQLLWVGIGLCGLMLGVRLPLPALRRHTLALYGLGIIALLAVFVPGLGVRVNGARRWLRFPGGLSFQPSEFAKLGVVVFAAAYAERFRERMSKTTWGFLVPSAFLGLACMLILVEPDFGNSVLLGAVGVLVLIVGGMHWKPLLACGIAAVPAFKLLVMNVPYRRERVLSFLNPWVDAQDSGYQIVQSLLAMGTGGVTGVGLGGSHQKLGFLPEADTDFIFAVIGEELGLVGCLFVLFLFGLFLWDGFNVALGSKDYFCFLLAFGLTLLVSLQAVVNIAVTTGSMPPKGLPLPMVSTGGSSLLFSMFATGLLIQMARRNASGSVPLIPYKFQEPGYEKAFYLRLTRLGRRGRERFARGVLDRFGAPGRPAEVQGNPAVRSTRGSNIKSCVLSILPRAADRSAGAPNRISTSQRSFGS